MNMKQFLILFREPDGRMDPHTEEDIRQHRQDWQLWMDNLVAEKRLAGGKPLTLSGNIIKGPRRKMNKTLHQQPHEATQQSGKSTRQREATQQQITEGPYKTGTEIVGGFLLINAANLEEATAITQTCPIFDFDGFAEVREIMDMAGQASSQSPGHTADQPSDQASHQRDGQPPAHSSGQSTAPAPPPAPARLEENKAIVRRFNIAFIQGGDTNAFYEIVDPQVINHTAPPGLSKGADGMFDLITAFKKALPDLIVEITHQVAENDLVVTRKSFHATHTSEIMGIPPSGKKITINIIDIIRLRNGKYTDHWSIRDMSDLLRQAGK
jgi:predicted ester cyclase